MRQEKNERKKETRKMRERKIDDKNERKKKTRQMTEKTIKKKNFYLTILPERKLLLILKIVKISSS